MSQAEIPFSQYGQLFRDAWVAGVRKYYPGEPKPSYVAGWEDIADWERTAAEAVCQQVHNFLDLTANAAAKLTRIQKGRFIALCWLGQMYQYFPKPKPSYVADWSQLPEWQQETDADIFEHIEKHREQQLPRNGSQ